MARLKGPFRFERMSGLLKIAVMALALAAANFPLAPIYTIVRGAPVHVHFGPLGTNRTHLARSHESLFGSVSLGIVAEPFLDRRAGVMAVPGTAVRAGIAATRVVWDRGALPGSRYWLRSVLL